MTKYYGQELSPEIRRLYTVENPLTRTLRHSVNPRWMKTPESYEAEEPNPLTLHSDVVQQLFSGPYVEHEVFPGIRLPDDTYLICYDEKGVTVHRFRV